MANLMRFEVSCGGFPSACTCIIQYVEHCCDLHKSYSYIGNCYVAMIWCCSCDYFLLDNHRHTISNTAASIIIAMWLCCIQRSTFIGGEEECLTNEVCWSLKSILCEMGLHLCMFVCVERCDQIHIYQYFYLNIYAYPTTTTTKSILVFLYCSTLQIRKVRLYRTKVWQ